MEIDFKPACLNAYRTSFTLRALSKSWSIKSIVSYVYWRIDEDYSFNSTKSKLSYHVLFEDQTENAVGGGGGSPLAFFTKVLRTLYCLRHLCHLSRNKVFILFFTIWALFFYILHLWHQHMCRNASLHTCCTFSFASKTRGNRSTRAMLTVGH
jgi:hypothetical protein